MVEELRNAIVEKAKFCTNLTIIMVYDTCYSGEAINVFEEGAAREF